MSFVVSIVGDIIFVPALKHTVGVPLFIFSLIILIKLFL